MSQDIPKTCWSTKQSIYDDKQNHNKSLHILEDGASDVQVGDTKQVVVYNMFTIR